MIDPGSLGIVVADAAVALGILQNSVTAAEARVSSRSTQSTPLGLAVAIIGTAPTVLAGLAHAIIVAAYACHLAAAIGISAISESVTVVVEPVVARRT